MGVSPYLPYGYGFLAVDPSHKGDEVFWNPAVALTWTAGCLTKASETARGKTVEQNLTWVAGCLTAVSPWAEV